MLDNNATQEEKLPTIFYEFYQDTFEELLYKEILRLFNDEIQKFYHVSGFAQMPDGKYVVRLERTLERYQ